MRSRGVGARACALVVFSLFAAASEGEGHDARLDALLSRLRPAAALEREFTETKQLALLAEPLVSHGVMAFTPPDRLRWEVVAPEPSVLRVAGDVVELERPGARTRRLDLALDAGARGLVDAVRLLLSGDGAGLERAYALSLNEEQGAWRIALEPRDAAQRRVITRLELSGAGDTTRELRLEFANGDRSQVAFGAPR